MRIKTIFVDMDGVLCDWVGGVCRLLGRDQADIEANWSANGDICPQLGVTMNELWARIDAEGSEFWSGLSPYPWAHDLWALCNSVAPTVVLTSPSWHPSSLVGKLEWLNTHAGHAGYPFRNYLIGPQKAACAAAGKLLIDDRDKLCSEFLAAGGRSLLFPRLWNSARDSAADPMTVVKAALEGTTP